MSATRRWRLQWWLSTNEKVTRQSWYSNDCKICACKRARDLAIVMATLKSEPIANVRWSIARPDPLAGELITVANSSSYPSGLMRHHGH